MKERKKLAGTLLASAAGIAAGGYLAGLLAQLLRNYGAWRQAGGQLGFGPGPPLPRGDPVSILQGLFSFPYPAKNSAPTSASPPTRIPPLNFSPRCFSRFSSSSWCALPTVAPAVNCRYRCTSSARS